ncbi:hypothetical protein HN51_069234 [Arachis hypogaea]|uniref:L-tryptophan--pyruvate aminotransferase 1-like n=1 Tax=Arachis hypogaea TaxID=3818 RepID=UPI000DED16F2|nr:L-tryptophan--pyruvate aminotransferase 1-like [Arachis hypogaea]
MVVLKAASPPVPSVNKINNGYPCSNGTIKPLITPSPSSFINLDQGDPEVFRSYWRKKSEECTVVINGEDLMSYLSDTSNVCWFMLPELREAIQRLHRVVGNASVGMDKHIVVGTGSTQLFQAALFALSPLDSPNPINVVAASPYYSEYQEEVEILRSGLYRWGGDAREYDKNEAYIEVVTAPNNPCGSIRRAVANCEGEGKVIHDFAYYWPQYTPITQQYDHDLMLFTFSKCTGHAGSRIGWAIVKDIEVARKMTRFIQMSSIGVSKESQIRVAKIIGVICDSYQKIGSSLDSDELFFEYSNRKMRERWEKLRAIVEKSNLFSLAKYPKAYCTFTNNTSESYPAFAWMKCKGGIEDCESFLRNLKVFVRGGKRFGVDQKYARVSLLSRDEMFNEFLTRISNITSDRKYKLN